MLVLNGAYRVPVSERVSVRLRLGVAGIRSKHITNDFFGSTTKTTTRENTVSPYAGLAVTVTTCSFVDIEVGADFARAEIEGQKAGLRAFTVGARFRF